MANITIKSFWTPALESLLVDTWNILQVVSGKYLIITVVTFTYIAYSSINDKIIYSSYTSDSYNDYLMSKYLSKFFNATKFDIHLICNKILHPITLFLQNF